MTWKSKRLIGAPIFIALSLVIIWLSESDAMRTGSLRLGAAMIGPAFLVLGLATLVMPGYREERIARGEDITRMQGAALITPRWWVVMAVGLGLGFAHVVWLESGHTLLPS